MNLTNKLSTVQDVFEQNGYHDWYALLPTKVNSTSPELKCTFVNFKERRKAAITIDESWFEDLSGTNPLPNLFVLPLPTAAASPWS